MERKQPTRWETTFAVRGSGDFPLDMLRYDACHFAHEGDADAARASIASIADGRFEAGTYILVANRVDKGWQPTVRRWASFGFTVLEVDDLGRVVG